MDLLDGDDEDKSEVRINPIFAREFQERKKAQELRQLKQKYGDDYEDDDGEEEDEEAELFTDAKKNAFAETLWHIQHGTRDAKDATKVWWGKEDEEGDGGGVPTAKNEKREKPFTLKKQMTEIALGRRNGGAGKAFDGRNANDDGTAKAHFLAAVDDEIDLEEVGERKSTKKKVTEMKAAAPQRERDPFAVSETDTPDVRFVKEYFRDEMWKEHSLSFKGTRRKEKEKEPKTLQPATLPPDATGSEEEEFFDKAEEYEQQYQATQNRHQEGEHALTIQSYPRGTGEGTLRQKDSTRKEQRDRKAERAKVAEVAHEEGVKRMKKLKKEQIQKRVETIQRIGGSTRLAIDEDFLMKDFEGADWDEQMAKMFGESFYGDGDEDDLYLDGLAEEDDEAWAEGELLLYPTANNRESGEAGPAERPATKKDKRQQALQEHLSHLKSDLAQYHGYQDDPDKDPVVQRFRYATVPSDDIALTPVDVLTMDDRTLNDIAPLRFYAPYTTPQERRKFKYKTIQRLQEMRQANRAVPQDPEAFQPSNKYRTNSVVIDATKGEPSGSGTVVLRAAPRSISVIDATKGEPPKAKRRREEEGTQEEEVVVAPPPPPRQQRQEEVPGGRDGGNTQRHARHRHR